MLRLGNITLDVLSVRALTDTLSWDYAEHATIESLPVLQKIASIGRDVTLDVRLHPDLGQPQELLGALEAAGESGEVMPLQTSRGGLLGHFVLTSIRRSWVWTLGDGTLAEANVALTLKPHRAPPGLLSRLLGVVGSITGAAGVPTAVDIARDPSGVPLSEVVRVVE
jgi:phage protein U